MLIGIFLHCQTCRELAPLSNVTEFEQFCSEIHLIFSKLKICVTICGFLAGQVKEKEFSRQQRICTEFFPLLNEAHKMTDNCPLLSSSHAKVMNLRCPYCPKKFLTNEEATSHMDPCLKSRPYPCVNCSRRFKSAQNLSQHERIHTNVRPYNCQYCEKNFTQKSHLQQHERTHTGGPAFSCRNCGETFNIYSAKIQHEKNICGLHETTDKQKEYSSEKNAFVKIVRDRSPIIAANREKWSNEELGTTSSTEQNEHTQMIVFNGPSRSDCEDNIRQHYSRQIAILPQRLSLDDPSLRLIAMHKSLW